VFTKKYHGLKFTIFFFLSKRNTNLKGLNNTSRTYTPKYRRGKVAKIFDHVIRKLFYDLLTNLKNLSLQIFRKNSLKRTFLCKIQHFRGGRYL